MSQSKKRPEILGSKNAGQDKRDITNRSDYQWALKMVSSISKKSQVPKCLVPTKTH